MMSAAGSRNRDAVTTPGGPDMVGGGEHLVGVNDTAIAGNGSGRQAHSGQRVDGGPHALHAETRSHQRGAHQMRPEAIEDAEGFRREWSALGSTAFEAEAEHVVMGQDGDVPAE